MLKQTWHQRRGKAEKGDVSCRPKHTGDRHAWEKIASVTAGWTERKSSSEPTHEEGNSVPLAALERSPDPQEMNVPASSLSL